MVALGANVVYDSPDDVNVNRLDAGQGLSGLPGSILSMTGKPQNLLVPSTFPVDPATCQPIWPTNSSADMSTTGRSTMVRKAASRSGVSWIGRIMPG